ncbi:MAG: AMP-binding protein, partial [Planctomycetes bacterium]|nr:AMP-binding protein [Planctomycetota bacterium]
PFRPSQGAEYVRSVAAILADCGARFAVASPPVLAFLRETPAGNDLPALLLSPEDLSGDPDAFRPQEVAGGQTALLQYTSGSTRAPRGVELTHEQLLSNAAAWTDCFAMNSADAGVSWLPLYHDMGLSMVHLALIGGWPLTHLPPLSFLKSPAVWFRAITRERATVTAAPNFALGYSADRIEDVDLDGVDLSSVRNLFCGGEPIDLGTARRFTTRFRTVGFREESLCCGYGLAEAVCIVTGDRGCRADPVDADVLEQRGLARPAQDPFARTRWVVSTGKPVPGAAIRIVAEDGRDCPEREVGEILVRGPSVMKGYFGNESDSSQALSGEWLHTGDRGYLAGGRLHVTGRKKDLLIVQGRKIDPHDIEFAAWEVEGVRTGSVVAYARPRPEREEIVLIVESRDASPEGYSRIAAGVRHRIAGSFAFPPDEIAIVPAQTIAKTSSGKLRRSATASRYESGEARALFVWKRGEASTPDASAAPAGSAVRSR